MVHKLATPPLVTEEPVCECKHSAVHERCQIWHTDVNGRVLLLYMSAAYSADLQPLQHPPTGLSSAWIHRKLRDHRGAKALLAQNVQAPPGAVCERRWYTGKGLGNGFLYEANCIASLVV